VLVVEEETDEHFLIGCQGGSQRVFNLCGKNHFCHSTNTFFKLGKKLEAFVQSGEAAEVSTS